MESPVIHGEFTVERSFAATPGEVFAAFGEPELRRRWFQMPGASGSDWHSLDFRVGGTEIARGAFAPMGDMEVLEYRATFLEIVASSRLVFCYGMSVNEVLRWVSLVTVVLSVAGVGTVLRRTEQYAFLVYTGDGGHDVAHLRGGSVLQLNGLAAVLGDLRGAVAEVDETAGESVLFYQLEV
jgi:uncharacterized protein YndB with AHSA1/START domain